MVKLFSNMSDEFLVLGQYVVGKPLSQKSQQFISRHDFPFEFPEFVYEVFQQYVVHSRMVLLLWILTICHELFFTDKMIFSVFNEFVEDSVQFFFCRALFSGFLEIDNQSEQNAML